jgi:phosphoribosylpyrophosphate synthetase
LLARFLSHHAACIGSWDAVTIVPSSRGRADPHPLERVVRMDTRHARTYRSLLRPGSHQVHHRHGSDQAFDVQVPVAGREVLLIDDTFTSGAEVQSAASALHLRGAYVTAVVVIGRYLDLDFSDSVRTLWERARRHPFDFTRCCLCDRPW